MRPRVRRVVAVVALLALLCGLCVAIGALTPSPAAHRYPGNDAFAGGHVGAGDRVVLAGTVRTLDADRTVVALDGGPPVDVRGLAAGSITGADPAPGDDVWFVGVVRADGSVAVERALVRAPWEITYLYGVSAVGALVVLGRLIRTWRVDFANLQFVPREGDGG